MQISYPYENPAGQIDLSPHFQEGYTTHHLARLLPKCQSELEEPVSLAAFPGYFTTRTVTPLGMSGVR